MASRCCICGRKLTADKSVARGIGPICFGKMENEAILNQERQKPNHCKVCGYGLTYMPQFDELGLPCNHYCCTLNHCVYAQESPCPRERVYIKDDIYPLYKNKPKFCSFCGKQLNGGYIKHTSKTKLILECSDCREKNKSWRNNKVEAPKNLDIYIKNIIRGMEK